MKQWSKTYLIAENVYTLAENLDEKFFMVTSELNSIKQAKDEMIQIQNRNWEVIQEHFEVFKQNIHIRRDCDQLLFTRQQIHFNYDTVSSLLAITFANVKSYRSALYSYRINMLNSIPSLLNKFLPMSLVPRNLLIKILEEVSKMQSHARDRLSLAIPMDEILSY